MMASDTRHYFHELCLSASNKDISNMRSLAVKKVICTIQATNQQSVCIGTSARQADMAQGILDNDRTVVDPMTTCERRSSCFAWVAHAKGRGCTQQATLRNFLHRYISLYM